MKRRVVATGIGVVSSIGNDQNSFFSSIRTRVSGITEFSSEDFPNYLCGKDEPNRAGRIKNFFPENYFTKEEIAQVDYPTLLILKAVQEALKDSKIDYKKKRVGVLLGTAVGLRPPYVRLNPSLKAYSRGDTSFLPHPQPYQSCFMEFLTETPVEVIHKKYSLQGRGMGLTGICASGSITLCLGMDLIENNCLDAVICGGFDFFHPRQNRLFSHFKMLTKEKCRPFDKNRKGFQLGEGVGVVLLEELDNAKKRDAFIYGEIKGYGNTNDAFHLVVPSPLAVEYAQAIDSAVKDAGIDIDAVDYFCPVGRGGIDSDLKEIRGIKRALKDKVNKILINSIIANTGYALGASSILNFINTLLQMKEGYIYPTLNLENPDPKFNLNFVMDKPLSKKINFALVCSDGFAGVNTALLIENLNQTQGV